MFSPIKRIGLRAYLDKTAKEHDGFCYSHFVKMIDSGVNQMNLARSFKVSRPTMVRWLKQYDNERKKAIQEQEVEDLRT